MIKDHSFVEAVNLPPEGEVVDVGVKAPNLHWPGILWMN